MGPAGIPCSRPSSMGSPGICKVTRLLYGTRVLTLRGRLAFPNGLQLSLSPLRMNSVLPLATECTRSTGNKAPYSAFSNLDCCCTQRTSSVWQMTSEETVGLSSHSLVQNVWSSGMHFSEATARSFLKLSLQNSSLISRIDFPFVSGRKE